MLPAGTFCPQSSWGWAGVPETAAAQGGDSRHPNLIPDPRIDEIIHDLATPLHNAAIRDATPKALAASEAELPVPGVVYDKVAAMRQLRVRGAMMSWIIGGYPSMQLKMAGEASFAPLRSR